MSDYDPTDIRGQEVSREEAETRRRLAAELEELDLKWLMGSKRGRRIMWRLLEQAGAFQNPFNTNALIMARNCGFREYGIRVLNLIHRACLEQYTAMVRESTDGRSDGNGTKLN